MKRKSKEDKTGLLDRDDQWSSNDSKPASVKGSNDSSSKAKSKRKAKEDKVPAETEAPAVVIAPAAGTQVQVSPAVEEVQVSEVPASQMRRRSSTKEEAQTTRMSIRHSLHANMLPHDDCLPLTTKLIYVAPTVSTLPVIVILAAYGNSLYELCGAELSLISACIAGARSMDVITDPGMSYITDAFRSKWGRRRPFLITGCWLYGLTLLLLFWPPYGSSGAVGGWFGVMYISYFLTNTYCNIPYDALGPELTDNYEDRSRLFFLSGIFDGLGTLWGVGLPSVMEIMVAKTSMNDNICKPKGTTESVDDMCRLGNTCNEFIEDSSKPFVRDSTQTADELVWLAQSTTTVLNTVCDLPDNVQKYYVDLASAHADYCICRRDCKSACSLANKRIGFMSTGLFFGVWYIATIVLVFFRINERVEANDEEVQKKLDGILEIGDEEIDAPKKVSSRQSAVLAVHIDAKGEKKNPPIVPMMMTTLCNKPFTVLLPAWACDGMSNAVIAALLTYYVRYVIQPEFMTQEENGIDCAKGVNGMNGAENFSYQCSTQYVLAGCCGALFLFAAVGTPVWLVLVQRLGKVKTWLLWSCVMAFTNILFVFPGKGQIALAAVVCGLNGIPFGAKFLADAVLADIIDYDEFLTGSRREATYTMFKSFLPKIMAIPSIAIPISLLSAIGHVSPKNGMIQEQPSQVPLFLKLVGAVLTSAVSVLAFFLKTRFPLKTKEMVDQVAEGVALHMSGKEARDPISGKMFMYTKFDDEQLTMVWDLDHFLGSKLIETLLVDTEAETKKLLSRAQVQLGAAIGSAILSFILTIVCLVPLKLMTNDAWSFVPTLLIVALGISVVGIVFTTARFKAAQKIASDLHARPDCKGLLEKMLKQRRDLEALLIPLAKGKTDAATASGNCDFKPNSSDGGWDGSIQLPPVQVGKKANSPNITDKE